MRPKRPRLDPALYIGLQRYFLTFCTERRRPVFADAAIGNMVLVQLLRAADLYDMAVIAYCFMPDHLHLLIEGQCDAADALAFVHQAKQRSGYAYGQLGLGQLWQPSFYDRILRNDEETLSVVRYILDNPMRAGLVASPRDYPFSGFPRHTIQEVMEADSWQPDMRTRQGQP